MQVPLIIYKIRDNLLKQRSKKTNFYEYLARLMEGHIKAQTE